MANYQPCGPINGADCSTKIFPHAVIQSVRKQMKRMNGTQDDTPGAAEETLKVDDLLANFNLQDAALVEINIGNETVEEGKAIRCRKMLNQHSAEYGFGIIGIVKETIDAQGLIEFHDDYFARFPIYCDKSYSFYHALGDRRMTFLPSLWTLLTHSIETSLNRKNDKDIKWNGKGDGLVKGGLIIFDQSGKARYCYKEQTNEDLPLCDIVLALDTLRRESSSSTAT